jgi:hypothetical protein
MFDPSKDLLRPIQSGSEPDLLPSVLEASGDDVDNYDDSVDAGGYGSSLFDDDSSNLGINPASGLPMMDDSMIDVGGNPYGTDFDSFGSSMFDDSFGSSSSWDDF